MDLSILVAINDSVSSRGIIDFITDLPLDPGRVKITLLHVFRSSQAGKELMGQKYMTRQPSVFISVLEKTRDKLVERGFDSEKIDTKLVEEPYPTVTDGIVDQFSQGEYSMVVIGRKAMSKAEEFVKGDVCIKLVRKLRGAGVLVVTMP